MSNPERYVFRFDGDGSRVKVGCEYRVDLGDGRTVHVRVSRVSKAGTIWLFSCDVKEPGA